MPTRRSVLSVLALATPAGIAACATAPAVDPAAAWRNPGAGDADPRRWALAHAILAPNPHNRQPWLVDLVGADEIVFYADTARLLPATDPPNRQITLGCGAFIELLDMAARERGYRAEISLWPQGEPQPTLDDRPVAHIRLVRDPSAPRYPLFAQIAQRHTNRVAFDLEQPLSAVHLAAVIAMGQAPGLSTGVVTAPAERARLVDIGLRAFEIENRTKATHMESVRLMRIGAAEIARHRDGISLDGAMIETMRMAGLLTQKTMADPDSFASRTGLDMWRKMLPATPAFFWIRSADNSRATQIAAGRAYARAQLTATRLGLSMQPWSMALQEFPEMAVPYRETQAALGATPDGPVQMLVRLGHAPPAGPSPRRGLAEHIRA